MKTSKNTIPTKGIKGLRENWKVDAIAGLLVFLLALPLSLGIAKASGFPAAMGVLTAMIGGLFASFLKVSELTIKGPAAGLITVCAASVIAFGGDETGWKIACGAIVVAAVLQVLFGVLKFGSMSDFFPHSAVHGMLAAIGIIIIAKQIPVLLGDDPSIYAGEGPVELLMNVPNFISHAHWHIAVVGILGLIVMFGLPLLKVNFLKKLPAPMFVLTFTIPLSIYWHFKDTEAAYSLVSIGDFWGTININANFSMMGSLVFWKFVFMFLFVGTLESLLTVKAIDNIDPYKRESDYNSDLKAQGAANVLAGLLGGLPMISEVVRSSANVGFGAKTKWSNFFHGVFLLIAMLMLIPAIELIPNAALAAMLIYAGYRLAAPKEFFHAYKVGIEQLVIFSTTILVTLAEDLLLGVLAGIVVKFIFHLSRGATLKHMFKAHVMNTSKDNVIHLHVYDVAVFSNLGGFKKILKGLPEQEKIVMNMRRAKLIDHSFMTFIDHFKNEYNDRGGEFVICGLDEHKSLSAHPLSTKRKLKRAERTREFQ